jgi:hypothetical protein
LSSSITLSNTGATPATVCPGGSSVLATTGSLAGGSYCQPTTSCTFPDMITNVTFSSINNTTVCNGAATGGFTLFPAFNPTINAGSTIPVSVSTGGDIEGAAVWIDYNKDGDFLDSGEQVVNVTRTTATPIARSFTVPTTALLGSTRMRVSMKYNASPTSCEIFTDGEVEDYTVIVNEPLTCPFPADITVSSITRTEAGVIWEAVGSEDQYLLRYRPEGTPVTEATWANPIVSAISVRHQEKVQPSPTCQLGQGGIRSGEMWLKSQLNERSFRNILSSSSFDASKERNYVCISSFIFGWCWFNHYGITHF